MTERAVMTEKGLAVLTVVLGPGVVGANTPTAIPAESRANLQLGEILSAYILDPATPGVPVPLTPTRVAVPGAVPAGQIQLNNSTTWESGTALLATDLLVLNCMAGFNPTGIPGPNTERPAMTEKGLALFPIIIAGVAIAQDTLYPIPASLRSNIIIGDLVSAYHMTGAGVVTELTVDHPGIVPCGADTIKLDRATENGIFLDVGGAGIANTDYLVLYCRGGDQVGATSERPAMTEKGLATFTVIFKGGDQAGGPALGAVQQVIPASMRGNLRIAEILTAEIHAVGGGKTALTPVRDTPAGANEIQADSSRSFIRGVASPADDILVTDTLLMQCRGYLGA